MKLTSAHLRYLLAIYETARENRDVSLTAIARKIKVTKPSASRTLKLLMDRNLILRERYGKIYLTDSGFLAARKFQKKVELFRGRIPRMGVALTPKEIQEAALALAEVLPDPILQNGNTRNCRPAAAEKKSAPVRKT